MNLLKAKWRSLLADIVCWAYLGFLVMSNQYLWASVWFVSVLILNVAYLIKPRYVVIQLDN